jgi:hypothetical protein
VRLSVTCSTACGWEVFVAIGQVHHSPVSGRCTSPG